MNTDKYLAIGSSHKICEDYVVDGNLSPLLSCAIISDGCSGSPDTDVGARIVAYSFLKYVKEYCNLSNIPPPPIDNDNWKPEIGLKHVLEDFAVRPILEASDIASKMGINQQCLDCTVVMALSTPTKSVISFFGDGACIIEHDDGSKTFYQINYENDMPYYVSYFLDDNRLATYIDQCNPKLTKRIVKISKEGNIEQQLIETTNVIKDDLVHPYFWSIKIVENIKSVIITSDGIKSFQKNKAGIDSLEIAQRISNFKNYNGQFIQRRLNRMHEEIKKEDISHYDDLSVAGIRM